MIRQTLRSCAAISPIPTRGGRRRSLRRTTNVAIVAHRGESALLYVGASRTETEADMRGGLSTEWVAASWSESTIEHAIHGSVALCVAPLRAHVATGVDRIILIPCRYQPEQVERIAKEVLPLL